MIQTSFPPRIRFLLEPTEAESAAHHAVIRRVDAFWQLVSSVWRTGSWVGGAAQDSRLQELRAGLTNLHPELGLELWQGPGGPTLGIVGLEGRGILPIAELLKERAPRLQGLNVQLARGGIAMAEAMDSVRRSHGVDLSLARARVGVVRGHLLEVVISSHLFGELEDPDAVASELVSMLMGDVAFDAWVADVTAMVAAKPSSLRVLNSEGSLPLAVAELPDAIEVAGQRILSALPEQPYHRFCEQAPWLMFEVSELELPAMHQPELLSATTLCPEMYKCFLSGAPFSSRRFSRHGERFCSLQLGLEGGAERRLAQRVELEEALDRLLVPGGLGCVVSAGLGRDWVYVGLALTEVDACLPLLRRVCRNVGQATLSFYDDAWRDEWVELSPSGASVRARPPAL